jgi:hypothetical protein
MLDVNEGKLPTCAATRATILVARADWASAKAKGGCYQLNAMLQR